MNTASAALEPAAPRARPIAALAAEFIGAGFLVAAVIGSGIMAEQLSGGNVGLALLANTVATGAILYVLITIFGAVSGAQFNPAVTVALLLRRETDAASACGMIGAQIAGAVAGAWLAHAMFALPVLQLSSKLRDGPGQVLSEFIATFGLLLTIFGTLRHRPAQVAPAVALYITAAYWFTASTSFANPAVTIARALSDTFAGIAPGSVLPFIAAQLGGAVAAWAVDTAIFRPRTIP